MLVLAGAAVGFSINGGNIFGKANTATEEWNKSVTKEQEGEQIAFYVRDYVMGKNAVYIEDVQDIDPNTNSLPAKKAFSAFTAEYIPIYTSEQLQKIATGDTVTINGAAYIMATDAKYVLMNDLSNITMKPIKNFTGEFDGNGYTISGLNIDTTSDPKTYTNVDGVAANYYPAGLFETLVGATVKNLAIVNSSFSAKESIGAIAGQGNNVTIENCYVKDINISMSGASTAAVIGFIGSNGGSIKNCKVVSPKYSNLSYSYSGICNMTMGDIVIDNCEVINDSNETLTLSSGILNCADRDVQITNCKMQNITLNGIGGIFGTTRGATNNNPVNSKKISISGCTAKNIVLATSAASAILGNSHAAETEVTDCVAQGITKTSTNTTMGGIIVGVINGESVIIDNCKVKDVENYSTVDFGAILGTTGYTTLKVSISNCDVQNIENYKDIGYFGGIMYAVQKGFDIYNCNVSNIILNTEELSDRTICAGGIIGTTSVPANGTISKCTVSNMKVMGKMKACGGIIGVTGGSTQDIKNCIVSNLEVLDEYNATANQESCSVGGIVGDFYNGCISDCEASNVKIDSIKIICGGLVGRALGTNNEIKNCNVTNANINSTCGVIGGIAGLSKSKTFTNCIVSDSIINTTGSSGTGGIVGDIENNALDFKNCNVNNLKITKLRETKDSTSYVGGIVGIANCKSVQECYATNIEIICTGSDTGGICGHSGDNAVFSLCNVVNGKIEVQNALFAGGITGFGYNINDCVVKNTDILTSGDMSWVGGIAAQGKKSARGESLIQRCSVEDCNIEGVSPMGGIAGVAFATISECNVRNTNITSTGSKVGGIQGYGGQLSSSGSRTPVTMTDCHLYNCKITGASDVGYLQGKNTHGVSGVTDTFTRCDYDSQTTIQ